MAGAKHLSLKHFTLTTTLGGIFCSYLPLTDEETGSVSKEAWPRAQGGE